MTQGRHGSPDWLKDRWADRKNATVKRISGAVAHLQKVGGTITYSSICRSVEVLYGVSISANTIKRNDAAYEIYSANRSTRRFSPAREQALLRLFSDAPDANRKRLGPKIARLRRMRKDTLIAMLLQLQDTSERQKTNETNLRDEILRLLTTNIRQRSGQQGKGKAAEGI